MKTNKIVSLIIASLSAAAMCFQFGAYGAILGPYTSDVNTLHLWHMDTAAPVLDAVAGGLNLTALANGATLTTASFPGFGTALNTVDAGQGGGNTATNIDAYLAPLTLANGTGDNVAWTFDNTATRAFTYEAIIWIGFNPSTNLGTVANGGSGRNGPLQIINGDQDSGTRAFQFRLDPIGFAAFTGDTSTNAVRLEFITISPSIQNMLAPVPTTGVHAIQSNQWYHVAVTYNGSPSTADNLQLYWTLMDTNQLGANQIFSTSMQNNLSAVAIDLCIGNQGRNPPNGNFLGLVDEVRISKVARATNEMMFGVGSPTVTSLQPTNPVVGVGQAITFSVTVAGASPLRYQWRTNGVPIPDATNGSYVIASAKLSDLADYDVLVTNRFDRATSWVSTLTVRTPLNLSWAGSGSTWDTVNLYWYDDVNLTNAIFLPGDNVLFDSRGIGNSYVSLAESVSPSSVTVSADTDYSLTPATGSEAIVGTSRLTKSGGGVLIIDTDNAYTGPTVIQAGTVQLGNADAHGSLGAGPITNNGVLVFNRTADLNILPPVTGTGTVTNNGNGAITLRGTNVCTALGINAGVITMVGSNSLATCGNILIAGGYRGDVFGDRLDLSGSVTIGAGSAISMSADGTSATAPFRSSLHAVDGTNIVACPITLTTSGVVNTNSSVCLVSDAAIALTGPITGPDFIGKLIMRGTGNGIVAGPVTLANAHFSKTDGGTWVIAGTGGFWTNTDIAAGTLAMGVAGALPTSLNINFTGGSLDLAGYNQQIASMSGNSGPIGSSSTNADCTFTLNTTLANTYGSAFQDTVTTGTRKLGVTVAGSGSLTLSGGNNRLPTNGLVTVSGTLNLLGSSQTNIGGLSIQGGTVASGAFLRSGVDYDARAGTVNSSLRGLAGLTKSGPGTVTLAEASPYTGNTTISAGTLKLGSAPLFPVVYMSFDNVSGTNVINDGTGGAAMNGTVTGAGATIATGKNGSGLSLSGDGSKVVINHRVTALDGSSPGVSWTLGMWIQTTTAGAGFAYQGAGAWAANNTDFYLINTNGPGSGGHVGAVRNSDGFMAGSVTVNDGNWHFIAITVSSGLKSIYVDGVLDTTIPVGNSPKSVSVGTQVWIGGTTNSAAGDGVVNMTGLLDDVYIFERALTQSEIQTLMTVGGAGSVGTTLGAIPATPVITVENSATLDVSSLPSGLTLGPAQTLKGDGAFNVLGTLASQGTIEFKLNKTGLVLTNDSINNLSQITYGGTLKLDVSGANLSTSDTFKLFSATTYAGAFANIVPAFPSVGLAWNTNTLATDGTLRVAAGGPFTYPTNITATLTNGNTLDLSWPADHLGWILQVVTNSLGIGPTNNWFSIPISSTTNQVFITINPANRAVFYRLISP